MKPEPTKQQIQEDFIFQIQKELGCERQDDLDFTLSSLKQLKQSNEQLRTILDSIHAVKKIPFHIYSRFL